MKTITKILFAAVLPLLVVLGSTEAANAQTELRIAINAPVTVKKARVAYSEIFPMISDGGDVRQLTSAAASSFNPAWSPGPVVTTTTSRNGKQTTRTAHEIFIANEDGTGIVQVTDLRSSSLFPTWSPDGAAVAFRSDFSGMASVYKMALDSGALTLLRSPGNAPNWNP